MALRSAPASAAVVMVGHLLIASYYVLLRINDNRRIETLWRERNMTFPGYETMGGRYKFLTQINLIIQVVYFVLAVFVDVFSRMSHSQAWTDLAYRVRDHIFSSLAFPVAVFIVSIFWPLYFIDRELIFPRKLDEFVPLWINLYEHCWIGVIALAEMLLTYHRPASSLAAFATISIFGAAYMGIVFYIAHYGGFWLYPVLQVLAPVYRVFFFALAFSMVFAVFFFGKLLNAFIWGKSGPAKKDSSLGRKKVR